VIIPELLAVLSIAAATGLRLAVPLLLIGFMSGEQLWSNVPLLSQLPPMLVFGVLASWSTAELLLSKDRHNQRYFQTHCGGPGRDSRCQNSWYRRLARWGGRPGKCAAGYRHPTAASGLVLPSQAPTIVGILCHGRPLYRTGLPGL
jgi:hypothetical protein